MPDFIDDVPSERASREKSFKYMVATLAMEGQAVDQDTEVLIRSWVNGEISMEQLIEDGITKVKRRLMPTDKMPIGD